MTLSAKTRKILAAVVGSLVVLYIGFAILVLWSMRQPPETFGRVMAKMPGPAVFLIFPFETAWMRPALDISTLATPRLIFHS